MTLSLGIAVAGCGGGDDTKAGLPKGAAARVDDTVIPESAVQARVRAVYRSSNGTIQSFGPPDYPSCVKIKRLALGLGAKKNAKPRFSAKSAIEQCRVDFKASRARAVSILVRANWLAREAKRTGINVKARAQQLERDMLAPSPGRPAAEPRDAAIESAMTAREEGLMAALPISKQELAAAGGSVDYAARLRRLNKALHSRYASETICAKQYRVADAPECR